MKNKKLKNMEMTREQALQWLKEVKQNKRNTVERLKVKQNKRNTVERLTKIGIDEYEKRTGVKPTYIEAL